MSFLSPIALSLFALSVPLVLLYFLKVRRRERTVSSLLLWSTSLRDREASTFFQRLHRDPLLILQLLALLLLALAVARPIATVMGQGARKVVVVLDTSAATGSAATASDDMPINRSKPRSNRIDPPRTRLCVRGGPRDGGLRYPSNSPVTTPGRRCSPGSSAGP